MHFVVTAADWCMMFNSRCGNKSLLLTAQARQRLCEVLQVPHNRLQTSLAASLHRTENLFVRRRLTQHLQTQQTSVLDCCRYLRLPLNC